MTSLPNEYRSLVRELYRRAAEHHQPVNGTFELTERCNLSCRMCYVRQPARDRAIRAKELTAAQWVQLTRAAVDNGMAFVLLTGGEVFLRPDFYEIYEPLSRLGIVITLFTNGTLLTESVAARLAESPPSRTEITIYGATAETYEKVTRVPGSYARCCAGIEALIKRQVPLGLKSTLSKYNVGELDAMRQLAHGWGLPFSSSWLLSERRDGSMSDAKDCRLPTEVCIDLEAADDASSNDMATAALRKPSTERDKCFYCYAGQSSFYVNSHGKMNVCVDLPLPEAQPLDIGFPSAWKAVQEVVNCAPRLNDRCVSCDARAYCPSCPAWSMQVSGRLNEPVPYMCEIARARKARFS